MYFGCQNYLSKQVRKGKTRKKWIDFSWRIELITKVSMPNQERRDGVKDRTQGFQVPGIEISSILLRASHFLHSENTHAAYSWLIFLNRFRALPGVLCHEMR